MVSLLVCLPLTARAVRDHDVSGEQPAAECLNPAKPTPAAALVAALTEKPWRLEELTSEPVPGGQDAPHLLFTNTGELMGFGGCNYFIGKYRTGDEGKIIVSSMRATNQHCEELTKRETTLLTSLVMADIMQISDGKLTFSLGGNNLMKLSQAPDIAVDDLIQQAKLLKVHKKRAHKARNKRKKIITKSKKPGKTTVPKSPPKLSTYIPKTVQLR